MRHGSLFSGIGGFDLAAQWMGWENVFHCEWNDFGQKVLKHYWPNAESFGDITKTDFTKYHGTIDIISGGFPCQPYSGAGKRLGKEDDRHLWPEMLRAIREISPRYVVGENVRGLTNWNRGVVFDEVQADLEAAGYEVTPFLLPACAVNAPHRRDRIWFVAYAENNRCGRESKQWQNNDIGKRIISEYEKGWNDVWPIVKRYSKSGPTPHTQGVNDGYTQQEGRPSKQFRNRIGSGSGAWRNFPTQSSICSRNDGLSTELDGITFPKWRNESIKAYGNAVVPQVVYEIFKAIDKHNKIKL